MSSGSRQPGPSLATEFTSGFAGRTREPVRGQRPEQLGRRGTVERRIEPCLPARRARRARPACGRGSARDRSFASQVRIVQLAVRLVHRPAKQNGSPPASEKCTGRRGCFGSSGFCHSYQPSASTRQRCFGTANELAVGRTLGDGLRARVDHLEARLGTLRPFGDQAPAKLLHAPAVARRRPRRRTSCVGRDVEALEARGPTRGWAAPSSSAIRALQLVPPLAGVAVAAAHLGKGTPRPPRTPGLPRSRRRRLTPRPGSRRMGWSTWPSLRRLRRARRSPTPP